MALVILSLRMLPNRGYVDVDQLQAETTLADAAAKCGATLNASGTGQEVRIDCPFNCPGDHAGKKEIAINIGNREKVFCCHAYQCGFRGNMLTLMHGWMTGTKPTGDKLRGTEFRKAADVLAGRVAGSPSCGPSRTNAATSSPSDGESARPEELNVALIDSENDELRKLATIDEKFIVDVAAMNPDAASYVRQHPCLTAESMKKWRVGYLPHDGGGDKRGWSLRGHIVYPMLSDDGKVLSWIGRDPLFERKQREFESIRPELRSDKIPPMKHKVPKGFHRGQELFGQHPSRLREPGYREAIAKNGIIVVEGYNDVIGLDNLGIPAVAICSNRMTEAQALKIARWSKQLGDSKVVLLFDCEETGDVGAKEALWLLAQRGLQVRLGWSREMHDRVFVGRQPEGLSMNECCSTLGCNSAFKP